GGRGGPDRIASSLDWLVQSISGHGAKRLHRVCCSERAAPAAWRGGLCLSRWRDEDCREDSRRRHSDSDGDGCAGRSVVQLGGPMAGAPAAGSHGLGLEAKASYEEQVRFRGLSAVAIVAYFAAAGSGDFLSRALYQAPLIRSYHPPES